MADKHWTVTSAELARDLTLASSAKHPEELAAAFKLLYATVLQAGQISVEDLESEIPKLKAEYEAACPKM